MSRDERIRVVARALREKPELMELINKDDASWPDLLAGMHELIAEILKREGIKDKDNLSFRIVLEIASFIGGIQIYLPQGDELCKRIIKALMKQEFTGRNYFEISRRYKLSDQATRRIIHDQ